MKSRSNEMTRRYSLNEASLDSVGDMNNVNVNDFEDAEESLNDVVRTSVYSSISEALQRVIRAHVRSVSLYDGVVCVGSLQLAELVLAFNAEPERSLHTLASVAKMMSRHRAKNVDCNRRTATTSSLTSLSCPGIAASFDQFASSILMSNI
jgi:hypothetical protein